MIQFYPGLSVLTLGVHYVSGLDLWHAGLIVIGLAHCASLLLVRALARAVGMSSRWAFFAALVFAANPGFMYFDSQYAYESLAIPLLLSAVLCAVRARTASTSAAAWRFAAGGVVLAAATVVTHHVTSAMMAGLCLLVAIFLPTRATSGADSDHSLRRAQYVGTWVVAGFALISSGLWNLAISSRTRSYVLPSLTGGIHQLFDRITGSSPSTSSSDSATQNGNVSSHTPFSGSGVPSYEQVFAYAVPVLVVIGLLYSLWTIWRGPERWAQLRRSAPFLVFTVAYLGSLPLALTATGNQAAHRSWPFLFIGVGIFAIWGVALRAQGWSERRGAGPGIVVALVAVFISLNIGDISSGVNTAYRFPGPYTFGSDNRFNTAELSSLVTWADNHLATPGKVITDRFTAQPLVVGTRLGVPTNQESFANTLFKNPQEPSLELRTYLRHHGFRYFILDRRILTELPAQLFYQGYPGRRNLDLQVLGNLRNSTFIHEVHATKHYGVYVINP